ncbi:MAG: DegT/DnrJ/EryC1/StrS family aminotransferase [Acidobacteria bacterium]|nr:DegT/DnrJ/EryC1/StrS family aminotransferase [Acidobacteriota bacterium]
MRWKVPLFDLRLTAADLRAVERTMRTNWITTGPATERFERAVAELVGVPHALAVASGTAALHLAYAALGLGPGDEVLCPSLSFVATANAIVMTGATPVFVDSESESRLTISLDDVIAKITPRTRALAIVDYAGHAVDLSPIRRIVKDKGIAVVEDAAHAIGAGIGRKSCGAIGDIGCFSFYSNKNITTAEGGMITTANTELAERMRLMRSHGMTTLSYERHRGHSFTYDVVMAFTNYRMDDLRAALGLAQLRRLRAQNARRERIVKLYLRDLAQIPGLTVPFQKARGTPAYHIMPVLLPEGADRLAVMTRLRGHGIQTSIHYRPIHTFTFYRETFGAGPRLPVLDRIAPRLLTLPLYPHMTAAQVKYVATSLMRALAGLS